MNDKNYITPGGLRSLQQELKQLRTVERPQLTETISWAAGNGDRSENGDYIYGKKRLREVDSRIRFLLKRIENAEVIDPALLSGNEVRFGATVTILDEEDREKTYTIVGTDEVNLDKKRISWKSPLAKALLRKREGDVVTVRMPKGEEDVEILKVTYQALEAGA
ncbi:MAG: transcription elongation factor GreB [Bdellovibrionales bacterium]|nr:transcription elongation factor GreB [Bdellovibrionales bacterium]